MRTTSTFLALSALVCLASAALSGRLVAQQTSNCIWTTRSHTAAAECIANNPDCPNCCLHEHQTLNWDSCTNDGDMKKGTTTPKHFQAVTRTCTQDGEIFICSDPSGAGPCEHYKNDCTVIECE